MKLPSVCRKVREKKPSISNTENTNNGKKIQQYSATHCQSQNQNQAKTTKATCKATDKQQTKKGSPGPRMQGLWCQVGRNDSNYYTLTPSARLRQSVNQTSQTSQTKAKQKLKQNRQQF
jgi:hypothetical protein